MEGWDDGEGLNKNVSTFYIKWKHGKVVELLFFFFFAAESFLVFRIKKYKWSTLTVRLGLWRVDWLFFFFLVDVFSQKLEKQNWQNENSKYFFQTNGVNSLRLINLGLGWVFYLLPPVLFFCLSSIITLTTVAQTQSDKYKKKFQWTNLSLMFLKTRTVWCASSHITKGKTNRFTTPCFWILRFFPSTRRTCPNIRQQLA